MGLIGAGAMGKGLLYQSTLTRGIGCMALCDSNIDRAVNALESFGIPYEVADLPGAMNEILRRERVAVCEDGLWVAECESLDVVIEATSSIGSAGRHAMTAMEHGKHLVMMNSEIDLLFGPVFAATASRNKVVYTSCDGDQYGVLKHLIDDIREWGLQLVMAGNIKGYLDRHATASSVATEADLRNLDHRMCASFTDGTKLNIEMALIANACGMQTKLPGMNGPRMGHVRDVFQNFNFDDLWKDRRPFVDYILGAEPGGGVFVIGYCDNPYQREMLAYYKMGPGPFYLFYRHYHLCHIEAMKTVANAVTDRKCLLKPDFGFMTNVYAYAKSDLRPGVRLDGIGGNACYGLIENCPDNRIEPGLPIGLAENVFLSRAVSKDEKIFLKDVVYDRDRYEFVLFEKAVFESDSIREQNRLPTL